MAAIWRSRAADRISRGAGESGSSALVGRLLCDKWRVEQPLGSGGMSIVFAGTHRNGKRVAIKVLRPEFTSNPRIRKRFLREGYIANRVGHDGAVSVLDDAVDDGIVFLVMELLEGEALDTRCQRFGGKLPLAEVLILTRGLLDVLVFAHANGVVHRDVKPSNVFLNLKGEIKLLDFGIASLREVTGAIGHTHTGSMLGTPGFMAPEQARGRWSEVGSHTDIWAVGATMFCLLSGRLVHELTTPNEAMIASATLAPPSLATLQPDLPASIVELVDRALKLDPAERWQTASDMRDAVVAVLSTLEPHSLESPLQTFGLADAPTMQSADAWTRESKFTPSRFGSRTWYEGMQKSRVLRYGGILTLSGSVTAAVALIASIPSPSELRSGLVDSKTNVIDRSLSIQPPKQLNSALTSTSMESPPSRLSQEKRGEHRRPPPPPRGKLTPRAQAPNTAAPESRASQTPEQSLDLDKLLNERR